MTACTTRAGRAGRPGRSSRRGLAGILLAAGASRRLGCRKQLLAFRGRPLVRAIAEEALSACDELAIVLGAGAAAVAEALAGLPVTILQNDGWAEGMSSSIRTGAAWAAALPNASAVVLLACDQPRLTAAHLRRLAAVHRRESAPIVGSSYGGVVGVPALFDVDHLPELLALAGPRGARDLIRSRATARVEWPAGAFDVDTPEDAARLARWASSKRA